jgi:hypothetical protein
VPPLSLPTACPAGTCPDPDGAAAQHGTKSAFIFPNLRYAAGRQVPSDSLKQRAHPFLYRLDQIDEALTAMRAFHEVKLMVVS